MTDTTVVAPPPAPTPANETPINPAPSSSPTPVGSQAPPAPVSDLKGSEHRPLSRREAIQAAFDRATKQQDGKEAKGAKKADLAPAKAAEAKAGHNKPPEPTETEKSKINLKKRPGDQAEPEPQPRDRGRFAPRPSQEGEGTSPIEAPADHVAPKPGTHPQLPENAPFRDPPPRMAEHAKATWADTPEPVRGEVHRMHQEFGNAYNQLKPIADAFQPIAHFHQMAQQHGTTLEKALTNYVGMEQKLRSDVVGGLDVIVNNLNLKAPDGERIGLRDIAYHVLSQSPEALKQVQQGNAQQATGHQIGALHQEIEGLKSALYQMHTAQQFTHVRSNVDQFADSHPRFDELGPLIEKELQLGFDLETAYRRAELLKPATHAAQTGTPAAQTRAPADRSISGSPGVSGNPAPRRNEKPTGRREAIANAIKRVNGGV